MNSQLLKIEPPNLVEQNSFEDWKYCEKEEIKLDYVEQPQTMEEVSSEEMGSSSKVNEKETQLHTCCFCGENRKLEKMAKTPQQHEEFSKWYRILGEKFDENARKSETSRSHFDDELGESRLVDVFCEDNVVETKIGTLYKCGYCGQAKVSKYMTFVPRDEIVFSEWARILGKDFADNCSKTCASFICRSHFNVEWLANRPTDVLPVADFDRDRNEKDSEKTILDLKLGSLTRKIYTCIYCGERKTLRNLTQVTRNSIYLKKWVEILGQDFHEKLVVLKRLPVICRSHFTVKWKHRRPQNLLPCVKVDGKTKTIGEHRGIEQVEQVEVTESCSLKTLIEGSYPVVQVKLEEPGVDVVSEKNVQKTNLEEKSQDISLKNKNQYRFTCIYCGEKKIWPCMTAIPQNRDFLKEWCDILGQEFREKALKKKYSLICRSHFNVEWKHSRPHDVLPCVEVHRKVISNEENISNIKQEEQAEVDESCPYETSTNQVNTTRLNDTYSTVQVKLEEPDVDEVATQELIKCCYCEHQKILDEMALVPRDKRGLTRWMNILGVEFYQNVMKNKHSYICRTHFNEQWKSEKIPKNILPVKKIEEVVEKLRPQHILDNKIKSEYENLDSQLPCKTLYRVKQENITIQNGPSETKKIKIEVKKEDL